MSTPPSKPTETSQQSTWSRKQMEKAFAHHQAGRLKEAESYYRQVIRLEPDEPDANNLLGVLLFQSQRSTEGLPYLERATRVKPSESMFFHNYAVALRASGKVQEAIAAFARCVELQPNQADAMSTLVDLLLKQKRHAEAAGYLKKLVALKPLDAKSFKRLGDALNACKNHAEAVNAYRRACDLKPDDAAFRHQLGLCLQAQGDKEAAIEAYRKCLELNPKLAAAHNNLAILLADQGDNDTAVAHYELAVEHDSSLFQTRCNLGGLLRKLGRLDESIICLEKAVEARSDCAEAWCNLGNSLGDAGQPTRAMECYRIALLCKPDYAQARLNRSLGLLRQEDFAQGWVEYEWRSKLKECPRRHTSKPRWDGVVKQGQRILVHAEQGLGDTFQMARYAKWLTEQGMTVILECQKPIQAIVKVNEIAAEVYPLGEKAPEFDTQIPLMSLPSLLWDRIGFHATPYLRADEGRIQKWKERLAEVDGAKIGIAWQGNPSFKQDQFRSIPLAEFTPVIKNDSATFISLQKSHGEEQLEKFEFKDRIRVFEDLDEEGGAFMDTAALMSGLDLMVTSDSAIAHLAGALGVKTYLLLPFAADWRWFSQRKDCPWYPTVQMFRQAKRGDWAPLFAEITQKLLSDQAVTAS